MQQALYANTASIFIEEGGHLQCASTAPTEYCTRIVWFVLFVLTWLPCVFHIPVSPSQRDQ